MDVAVGHFGPGMWAVLVISRRSLGTCATPVSGSKVMPPEFFLKFYGQVYILMLFGVVLTTGTG